MRNPQHARQTQHGLPVAARVVRETIDRAIAVVAGRQHGLITTRQLLDLGLSMSAIEHRARVGRLHRLHRGVYAVGHRPVSPLAHALAAVLACGPGATLSHSSAGTLWGISKHWHPTLEVTTRCCRSRRGLRVHRSKTLTAQDITVHFGIPTTTPARTLLDNAPRLADSALARAVNDLRLAGYLSLVDLSELLDRHPDTHAAKRLRKLLARPERPPTRSEFEDAFLLFAERYALPEPQVNITSPATKPTSSSQTTGSSSSSIVTCTTRTASNSKATATAIPTSSPPASPPSASRGSAFKLKPAREAARLSAILEQRLG
jgi:predicted transcriptional regulator of viral defense system